MYSQDYF